MACIFFCVFYKRRAMAVAEFVDASIWGLALWDFLFTAAFAVDADRAPALHALLINLQHTLPCDSCRRAHAKMLKKKPLDAKEYDKDPHYYAKWLWTAKDAVNQRLSKPYTCFNVVSNRYRSFHSFTSDVTLVELVMLVLRCPVEEAHAREFVSAVARVAVLRFDDALCARLRDAGESPDMQQTTRQIREWLVA